MALHDYITNYEIIKPHLLCPRKYSWVNSHGCCCHCHCHYLPLRHSCCHCCSISGSQFIKSGRQWMMSCHIDFTWSKVSSMYFLVRQIVISCSCRFSNTGEGIYRNFPTCEGFTKIYIILPRWDDQLAGRFNTSSHARRLTFFFLHREQNTWVG